MCHRVTCRACGRPSWAGCGAHVEMVLADVPLAGRCRCREERAALRAAADAAKRAATAARKAAKRAAGAGRPWWERLLPK